MDPEALYMRLGRAVQTMPELRRAATRQTQDWLAQVYALLSAAKSKELDVFATFS